MAADENLENIDEVDIIIAGGGTAACVVAARLAAANKELSILVIEGGKNNYQQPNVVHPTFYLDHLAPGSPSTLFYTGNKSEALGGRQPVIPTGGILGGGSSINFMMYSRAQGCDFDAWKMPGWSAQDLLPTLKKLETYHAECDPKTHGSDGPVQISPGYHNAKTEADFLQAAAQVGYPELPDLQDLESVDGCQRGMRYISPEGYRQDTAHCYLHPLLQDGQHPKLRVLLECKVIRVIFDSTKQACGVECLSTRTLSHPSQTQVTPSKQIFKARRMVILSCGALGTPPILERSGIGDPSILNKILIPIVVGLPGVGQNYQDHQLVIVPYTSSLVAHEIHDSVNCGCLTREEAIDQKVPQLAWNALDVCLKLRPSENEVVALGTDFEEAWTKDYMDQPSKPMMLMAFANSPLRYNPSAALASYVSMGSYTPYPYSRGSIHISGPQLSDPLDFEPGFLTDLNNLDLKMQVWAYKKQREIMRRTMLYRGEPKDLHPQFPLGSDAACLEDRCTGNVGTVVKDLVYSQEDDEAIEQFIRKNLSTAWHSLGTAKMAPREEMGVVDAALNVYGVSRLKVIDLSIVPCNVGTNTNNTAILIGEKGAAIVLEELGL